ncbi:MAG: VWA domain-containing protein [Thermodesulfobacteriota bacterium]
MQFLNPIGFLLLGLIPILLIIHSLRPKPSEVEVTALFLWKGALKEMRGGGRIRSLLKNLPLLFQILIIILASLALAEPVWTGAVRIKGDAVLVIDSSVSMQAKTPKGSRMDWAKKEAYKLIEGLSEGSRMLILEAADKPRVLSPFSPDKKYLQKAVERLRPKEVTGDLEGAVFLALSFLDPEKEDRIYLLTDGALAGLSPILLNHRKLTPLQITESGKNVGITHFECRSDPGFQNVFQGWLEIKNFNPHPVIVPIKISSASEVLFQQTIGLRTLEKKQLLFPFSRPRSEIIKASLEVADDLYPDNQAYSILPFSEESTILLVTRGNFFLKTLLESYPNFKVQTLKEIKASSWEEWVRNFDVIILDGISPPSTTLGNFLLINTVSPSLPLNQQGIEKDPIIVGWDRSHPIMQNLELGSLRIPSAPLFKASPGLKSVLESRQGGLIFTYEKPGLRVVLINFNIGQTDLPRRLAFPVLMTNCFHWLQPYQYAEKPRQIKTGESFPLYFKPGTPSVSIVPPDGKSIRYPVSDAPFLFRETEKAGLYTAEEGMKKRVFAANVFSETESDLRIDPSLDKRHRPAGSKEKEKRQTFLPLWFWVLLTSVVFLVLECFIWLRKD